MKRFWMLIAFVIGLFVFSAQTRMVQAVSPAGISIVMQPVHAGDIFNLSDPADFTCYVQRTPVYVGVEKPAYNYSIKSDFEVMTEPKVNQLSLISSPMLSGGCYLTTSQSQANRLARGARIFRLDIGETDTHTSFNLHGIRT